MQEIKKKLGELVKEIRKNGPYPNRMEFCERAKVGTECLRKIEQGVNAPERKNMESIVNTARPPKHIEEEIWSLWRQLKIGRYEDIPAPKISSRKLGEIGSAVISKYMKDYDFNIPPNWEEEIADRLEVAFEVEIYGKTT